MTRVLLDIAVNSMLDSSLVAAQALVLNRLGIPFAAITAFSGIGAYAIALTLRGSLAALPLSVILCLIGVIVFSLLARPLPQDRYLLLTLAVLGVLRATSGTVTDLGGQLGMNSASAALPPQASESFVLIVSCLFIASLLVHKIIGSSEFGLAIAVTQTARTDVVARSFVPVTRVTLACFAIAALIAVCAGILRAMYAGRVDPNQFRVQTAIILLMPTLLAGSSPLRIGLVSLTFFAFPDLFGVVFGYDATALAFVRDITWSALIIILVSKKLFRPARVGCVDVLGAGN